MNIDLQAILAAYGIDGSDAEISPYGNGHINSTFNVNDKYLVQKINTDVFRNPEGLMNNIILVTDFLRKGAENPEREVLTIVRTRDGKPYFVDSNGLYWRVYTFIEKTHSIEVVEEPGQMRFCGFAFGDFQRKLGEFDASLLVETIPNFHNTIKRFEVFEKSLKADKMNRAASCKREIDFVLAHKSVIEDIFAVYATLPLRVTHNDTKINNVLIDDETGKPLCVVDLDTIMPGYASNDFGDAVRFGASTAAEDEEDLAKVHFDKKLYDAFLDGFLEGCGNKLTQAELDALPLGSILMTFECGMRFLTDYLDGDVYFKIDRPDHNLLRCRTQFRLCEEMEAQLK